MIISKTTFLEFLDCPKNTWLKLHKKEIADLFVLSEFEKHLMEQGNAVELVARNLFPDATFQATFIADDFIVKNDILSYDTKNDCWNLYEVKGTNSLKEDCLDHDHIIDITFQASVMMRAGMNVGKYFIIHLNREYVKNGDLDINSLFVIADETEKVLAKLPEIEKLMDSAKKYLSQTNEPTENCDCIYKTRNRHCATFKYSNPHIPHYSVHDLSRISKNKLNFFINNGIFDINDIPDNSKLTINQRNQVITHQKQKQIIHTVNIKKELDGLSFPLYFFDYETFGPAIPVFDGYKPYQRIPFQFSLHILKTPTSKLEHIEYLHEKLTDPSVDIASELEKYILPGGTVIVWHKSFEMSVNREISARLPQYEALFDRINNSIYDLEDIFHKQYYVHHRFRGSTSIKKVLPIITPELQYDKLPIHAGDQAANAWWKMMSPTINMKEKRKIANNLKTYCKLDTYAMYSIYKALSDIRDIPR